MKRLIIALGLLLQAVPCLANNAPPSAPLAPSTPWTVDYAENECRLLRTFGTGDDAIILRIAQYSSADVFDVVLAGKHVPNLRHRVNVRMIFGPQNAQARGRAYSMEVPNSDMQFIRWFDVDAAAHVALQNAQTLQVSTDTYTVRLAIPNIRGALSALHTCTDDLLQSWGYDVAGARANISPATAANDEAGWVTTDDYPGSSVANREQGVTTILLLINAEGRLTGCSVRVSSGSPALDAAACTAMMAHARFRPAIGPNSTPVASQLIKRVRWLLP